MTTHVFLQKLAEALVARLNDVVPAHFRLSTHGKLLHVHIGGMLNSILSLDIVEEENRDLDERLRTTVWSVINSLQNDISEDLRTPWPSIDGRTMAMPEVHSDGEWLHLWYGDRRAPVLSMPAIRIAEITNADNSQ
jgi:hypothetical protein